MPTPPHGRAAHPAGPSGPVPSRMTNAAAAGLAAALGVGAGVVAHVAGVPGGGPEPDWRNDPEACRVAVALLRGAGERRAALASLARAVAPTREAALLDPPRNLPAPEEARQLLVEAHAARDWVAAYPALIALRPPEASHGLPDAEWLRLAETAAAVAVWPAAQRLAAQVGPGPSRIAARIVLARAHLGMGEPRMAWAVLDDLEGVGVPASVIPVADAALAGLRDAGPAAAAAGAVTRLAVLRAPPVGAGQGAGVRTVGRDLRREPLSPPLRRAVLEARCALAPGGWAGPAEARWVRWLDHLARRDLAPVDAVLRALTETGWHREAHALLGLAHEVGPGPLLAMAQGLAAEGAWDEPAALLPRLRAAGAPPGPVAALERHIALLTDLARGAPPVAGPGGAIPPLLGTLRAPALAPARPAGPWRVAHVATSFGVGGAERQLATVLPGLAARDPAARHNVILSDHSDGTLAPAVEGLRVRIVRDAAGGPATPDTLPPLAARAARLGRIRAYQRVFEEDRPDAVMTWKPDLPALIGAALAGVPRLVHRQGSVAPIRRPGMRAGQRAAAEYSRHAFGWLADHTAARFVANSAAALTDLVAEMHWPSGRSFVLPNALDPGRFGTPPPRAEARARLGLPPDAAIVGGCFRLSPEKRPFLWLDTAEACLREGPPSLLFVVAGDGPLLGRFTDGVAARGLSPRIRTLGQLGGEMAVFHAALDVLLHTAAFEGLPNAVVEAQWAGVPVVATDAGGTAEAFLPGVTGTLVREDTAAALAAATLSALTGRDGFTARRDVFEAFVRHRFSLEACLDRLTPLLGIGDVSRDP